MARTEQGIALGSIVREYRERAGLIQQQLADRLTASSGQKVGQGKVSKMELGEAWGDNLDLIAHYVRVLDIPPLLMAKAAGFPVPDGPGGTPAPTLRDLVEADPTLSRASKDHLINQYGLLQAASRAEPDAPAKNPRATKARKTG